jgi:1,2-dihydroxy-3-keto-5-methylthiopentene dioxygenase
MTLLITWPESGPETELRRTSDPSEIKRELARLGLRFDRWPLRDEETVLAAYREEIDVLVAAEGFATVDVVALHPDDSPDWPERAAAARAKFLQEHVHEDDDEVRFFADGAGVFYLHLDGHVHAVLCEGGDLLGVPRGTRHWFDMGSRPSFTAVRFFHLDDGWVADFTGDPIADRFPDFAAIAAERSACP